MPATIVFPACNALTQTQFSIFVVNSITVEVDADIRGFASDELSSDSDEYYSEDMDDEFIGSEEDNDYSEDDDTSDGMVKYLNTSQFVATFLIKQPAILRPYFLGSPRPPRTLFLIM